MFFTVLKRVHAITVFLVLAFVLFFSWGCAGMSGSGKTAEATSSPENTPYYPTELKDLQVPGELEFKRENSMYINTSSFAGGILNFTGRVEINSLTDFFVNTMVKHGWNLSGSIRYKNVLLAFVRPHKTCLIEIKDTYGLSTQVNVYITEDISEGSPALPSSEEVFH